MTDRFKPLSNSDLQERYGTFYPSTAKPIDPAEVPENLRDLIPYAELWGVPDDVDRDEMVENSPPLAREDLIAIFEERDDDFDDWLAGPEADGPEFSDAYIAFSNFRIAYDYASEMDDDD